MVDVTMPKLSDSMEVGKVIAWRAKPGDVVHEGDVLAEVESDKAVMELECFRDGTLAEIVKGDGAEVAVGEVIARIAAKDEAAEKRVESPKSKVESEQPKKESAASEPVGASGAASPYARRLAAEKGIDISKVAGTGPGGRIVAKDVEGEKSKAPASKEAPRPAGPKPSPDEELPPIEAGPEEASIEEASFRVRTMAMRVTASKHVIPHFYVTKSVDVTALFARLDEVKAKWGATLTHVVELAALAAIAAHPDVNRSYDRGRIVSWKGVHLGLAVATDDGLTVAVLRDAQGLGLKDLAERTRALVAHAREGKLSGEERRHPTFAITNLGMFGVEEFSAIINPPAALTLAVAAALDTPVVRDGAVVVGKVMKLTLSCDHRIVDGVLAAQFLGDLAARLEAPGEMLG